MSDVRRRTWPGPMSKAGVEPGHRHDFPPALLARVRMLTRSLVIFGVCLVAIGTCLVLILLDRMNARDEQNARTNQRINNSICDLLDQLPEGGLLDRPRHKYHCGPGIPLADLTPQEQAQLSGRAAVVKPPAMTPPPRTGPGPGGPETPSPSAPRPPSAVTAPASPTPSPSSTSPGPLDPVTSPVCNALGICL